jgi:6-pyruvoyltetrahydropterin/6-carboxytetrahydropterin synthase
MPKVSVTRKVHFSAAHRLFRPEWSDARNRDVFGDCSNPHWHGHNYELDVTVRGAIDPETGFVMDLKSLKAIVEELVVEDVDHWNLNREVPWLEGVNPTTENLVVAIWDRLVDRLTVGIELEVLTLWETPRNYVRYEGP